jgi:hypothetical protein
MNDYDMESKLSRISFSIMQKMLRFLRMDGFNRRFKNCRQNQRKLKTDQSCYNISK